MISSDEIKSIALENGFTLREQPDGSMDLNHYVYTFAMAMYRKGRSERVAEIRPLVDSLGLVVTHHIPLATMREEGHNMAVERLRELVREGE
jgi:hypothetical protein